MPPKRTPFTSLENEAVVKRVRTTAAKDDGPTSSQPAVKSKLQISRTGTKVLKTSDKELLKKLPVPPEFDYFKSPFPPHDSRPLLPDCGANRSALDLFGLFFNDTILELIVTNTNRYAELKRLPIPQEQNSQSPKAGGNRKRARDLISSGGDDSMGERPWNPMSLGELKVFIGLQILMGIYRYPGIEDYWSAGQGVKHPEFNKMSCNRYQQIKRYFHLSPPDEVYERADWWRKMEPLASHLRKNF